MNINELIEALEVAAGNISSHPGIKTLSENTRLLILPERPTDDFQREIWIHTLPSQPPGQLQIEETHESHRVPRLSAKLTVDNDARYPCRLVITEGRRLGDQLTFVELGREKGQLCVQSEHPVEIELAHKNPHKVEINFVHTKILVPDLEGIFERWRKQEAALVIYDD